MKKAHILKPMALNVLKTLWERYGTGSIVSYVAVKQMAGMLRKTASMPVSYGMAKKVLEELVDEGMAIKKVWAGGRRNSYRYDGLEVTEQREAFDYAVEMCRGPKNA